MLFLDPRGTCLLSSRLPMKIDDSMPAGAVRTRPAASAAASGTVPAKPTAADVADFLGISEAELTPHVQQGQIGSTSCRGGVCKSVTFLVVSVSFKKKSHNHSNST